MSSNTSTKGAIAVPTPLQPSRSTQADTSSMTPIPLQHGAHVSYGGSKSTEELCQIAAELEHELEANIKAWDLIGLTSALNQLLTQNFPLQIIMKYQLGKLVNAIKKKAEKYGNKPIQDASERIKFKWRKLIPPTGGQTPSRSPTPSPSPSPLSSPKESELVLKQPSPPPTAQSQSTPKSAPFRLAIQKDPPTKPKAITNTSFFDKLNRPSMSSTVRPRFGTQRLPPTHYSLNDMLNRINQDKEIAVPSPVTSPPTSPTATTAKKRPFELVPSSSSTLPDKSISKPRSKRVRFKPDHQLVTTRVYEKNPEEWNFDQTEHHDVIPVDQARNLDISEGQVLSQAHHPKQQQQPSGAIGVGSSDSRLEPMNSQMSHRPRLSQKQNKWYSPRAILIPDSCKRPWPRQSSEASVQQEREKVTLAAVYISLAHVPPTPAEADEPVVLNDYTPIIPLQDINVNTMESYTQQQQQQQQVSQQQQSLIPQQEVKQVVSTSTYGANTSLSTSSSLPSQPVHLLHPYQPPQQLQPVPKSEPQFTSQFVSQPQVQATGSVFQSNQPLPPQQSQPFAPQQPQPFAPQQSQPFASQQSQSTDDPANITWSTGLLGALTKLIKDNPSSSLTQLLAQQLQQEQLASVSAPAQPSTSSCIPSTTPQFSHQYPQGLHHTPPMNFRSSSQHPDDDEDDNHNDDEGEAIPKIQEQRRLEQQRLEEQHLTQERSKLLQQMEQRQLEQQRLEQQRLTNKRRKKAKRAATRGGRGGNRSGGPGPNDHDDGALGPNNSFAGGGFGSSNNHRGGSSNRGSFRGQRGRGGGRGPSNRVCRFYDTPTGCVNGDNCPFIHVD